MSLLSWIGHELFMLAVTLLPMYLLANGFYQLFLSPLSGIPGPWYAAVSDFWLLTHVVRLKQCMTVHDLFETYGPVVRVASNKVAFRDLNAVKAVYTKYKFDKGSFYKNLQTNNNDHAMSTLPHAEHTLRKKAYAPHYVPAHINQFQPEMQEYALELVEILEDAGGKGAFECLAVFRHLMVDIISVTVYGTQVGALRKFSQGIEDPLTAAVEDFPTRGIVKSAFPKWVWEHVSQIPIPRWRKLCDSDKVMGDFIGARVTDLRKQAKEGKLGQPDKTSLLHRLVESGMIEEHIISEAEGHTVAGVDTSSTTLSYLFWELSRRPDVLAKLQPEIDEALTDARSVPDVSVLHKLPHLTAFIKEGLRLYAAAPTLLERVVPASTTDQNNVTREGFDLMGFNLPPNTIIATQPWSLHREASVFPAPNTFLPDRWLATPDNEEQLSVMNQYLVPFGVGSRVCGGQNLAQTMLRIVVALVVRNFAVVCPPETNDLSMTVADTFTIAPMSKECKLRFIPRKH